ncbi:hypothetical protein CPB86DRAFT_828602 [Serendipita vermifera]|nr:hypothetical protein CPB86DRAFT_828602 [Serendipita vermifera]
MERPTVINIFDSTKSEKGSQTVDLSTPFNLERIKAHYTTIPKGESKQLSVPAQKNHLCYIVVGNADLEVGKHRATVTKDECFSFAASDEARAYTLTAAGDGNIVGILTVEDTQTRAYNRKNERTDGPPTIISAPNSSKWYNKGINLTSFARLGRLTDMGIELDPIPWSLNRERLPPGTQSSNNHAHSRDDEFAIILSGQARYWHQGLVPEPILKAGDAVGWKAGTGICHCLLNDAENEDLSGEDLVFLEWGEDNPDTDKLHFGTANPIYWTNELKWHDRPDHPLGSASPLPRFPRPDDKKVE